MADKEVTVYIVDQGSSMGTKHNGREEDDLSFSLQYIWDKITTTIQADRKTFTLGIIGLRTDDTEHGVEVDDHSYDNISVQQEIKGAYSIADLREAQEKIKVSGTEDGDAISAVVVAYTMIDKFAPPRLKYKRKIVLVTNARGYIDGDDFDDIAERLNDAKIELLVLGVDFDDAEYGLKEEDKDPQKAQNEKLLRTLCDKCDTATFGTIAEAIGELSIPRLKQTKPYSTYKGPLWLGDPKFGEDRSMVIQVERYFKTKKAAAPSSSTFVKSTINSNGGTDLDGDTDMGGVPSLDGLTAVKSQVTYQIDDAERGKLDVDRESLAKGYAYGRTAVPISASEESVTKLETKKEFTIIGFVPEENYPKYFTIGESRMTVAMPSSTRDKMALSSFVHGLAENESYAIARFVAKDGKDPVLLLLAPFIEPDVEGLIDVELPFQEDVRLYKFPPLDHVLTVSGAVLSKHRHLPTDDLTKAMDAYVDSMDLSKSGVDEEGNPTEYLTFDENYRPDLHRISQGIRYKAAWPDKPIPPIPDILVKFRHPQEELVSASKEHLNKLIELADVKKVPEKVGGKGRTVVLPKSNLDVIALLADRQSKITPENCIPEFKQALDTTQSVDGISNAVEQFTAIIRDGISGPLIDKDYETIISRLVVLKNSMIEYEEPGLYNNFMKQLKQDMLEEKLGGDRRDLWFEVYRTAALSLIVGEEEGQVTEEEARKVMSQKLGD